MRTWILAAAVASALACAAPCAAAPTGWRAGPSGRRPARSTRAPGGGAVVVNQGVLDAFVYTVSAYRLDGRRRWVNRKRASCGNCDEGPQPARRQADGTCIATEFRLVPPGFEPENSLVSRRGAAVLWSVVEPGLDDWFPENNVAPHVVRDGAGNVYTAYGQRMSRSSWNFPTAIPMRQ